MYRQQTTHERGAGAFSGHVWAESSARRFTKLAAVLAAAVLVLTGCASKSDKSGNDVGSSASNEIAAGLKKEGPIAFVDHNYSSSTIQAEVLTQVFQRTGADAKVQPVADIPTVFAAASKDKNLFDPDMWTYLAKPQFKKYVEDEKTVDVFSQSKLTGEEGWYVPTYVIKGDPARGIKPTCPGLPDWKALNGCAHVFATAKTGSKGQYMSGAKEWDGYYGDPQRIKNLGLNYQVEHAGSEAALNAEWKRAYDQGKPFLGLMWTPTYTGLKYDMTRVEFPPFTEACWGTTYACNWEDIVIDEIASKDFKDAHPTAAKILAKYDLNNEQILQIMTLVEDKGLSPKDAVTAWLDANPEAWQAWVS